MKSKFSGLLIIFLVFFSGPVFCAGQQLEWTAQSCSLDSSEQFNHLQFVPESWFTGERTTIEELRSHIKTIESAEGVYSYQLVPVLVSLATLVQEQNDHAMAAENFERALYIVRANDGLYSPRQLAILDRIIESKSAVQQWKEVANSYDMMNWLYGRNFSETDPRQLKMLKRLRRWYIESYNKETGRTLEQLFQEAESVYDKGIQIMRVCTAGDERQALCLWHRGCCEDAAQKNLSCPLDKS